VRLNFAGDQETFRRQVTSQNSARQSARAGDRIYAPITLQIANDDAAEEDKLTPLPTRLALMSTIQFTNALPLLKDRLTDPEDSRIQGCCPFSLTIPRSKPLSPGELLGCTAPNLADVDALL
jgi:2-(3-amino-3-carboxypropyl)histidine synthase